MTSFNLSDWALRHKSFVLYLMGVIALAGIFEYRKLGREEDPPFTIKTMVVKTLWPGATATETLKQVTDRIEKKLEEVPGLDFLRSYTKPGESVVMVNLKDTTKAVEVPELWYQVRKKVGDIRSSLPSGPIRVSPVRFSRTKHCAACGRSATWSGLGLKTFGSKTDLRTRASPTGGLFVYGSMGRRRAGPRRSNP